MGSTTYTLVDGELLAEYRQGSERDYVGDALGSTVALLDGSQQFTDRWTYWPYGEERTRTGATPTPFRFVGTWGYYQDAAASLYVRARYYRPGLGRWQTVDPLWWGRPGGRETYQYCDASPIGMNDPSGLQPPGRSSVETEGCSKAQHDGLNAALRSICQKAAGGTQFDPSGFTGACREYLVGDRGRRAGRPGRRRADGRGVIPSGGAPPLPRKLPTRVPGPAW